MHRGVLTAVLDSQELLRRDLDLAEFSRCSYKVRRGSIEGSIFEMRIACQRRLSMCSHVFPRRTQINSLRPRTGRLALAAGAIGIDRAVADRGRFTSEA